MNKIISTSLTILGIAASLMSFESRAKNEGKTSFENNCLACHQLKKFSVGPSLVEIRKSYPKSKRKEFIAWALNPGRKRPEGIQMPSMSHVGEEKLALIHDHILKISKGVKVTKSRHEFSFTPPAKTYPYIKRSPMAFASPAAIGVVFSPKLGVSWDASSARLKYAFVGDQPLFNGEGKEAKLASAVLYQETASQLWSFANKQELQFLGYRIKEKLPEFIYQVGDIKISERYQALADNKGFTRVFSLSCVSSSIALNLAHTGSVTVQASKGEMANNQLTLTAEQAKQFSITVSLN